MLNRLGDRPRCNLAAAAAAVAAAAALGDPLVGLDEYKSTAPGGLGTPESTGEPRLGETARRLCGVVVEYGSKRSSEQEAKMERRGRD